MYKKLSRADVLFLRIKLFVFLPFALPSPSSLLKLPNISSGTVAARCVAISQITHGGYD